MNTSIKAIDGTQSIQRALLLLNRIGENHEPGSELRDLVTDTGLERTTVYRLLSILVAQGFVQRDPISKKYRLGISSMKIGLSAMTRSPILESTRNILLSLARTTEDSVFLTVANGDYAHCLHMEQGSSPLKVVGTLVGNLHLLGIGIAGKALLTPYTQPEIERLYARHENKYTQNDVSINDLHTTVEAAKENGFAYGTSRIINGLSAVGVIFETDESFNASISIASISQRLPFTKAQQIASLIKEKLAAAGFKSL